MRKYLPMAVIGMVIAAASSPLSALPASSNDITVTVSSGAGPVDGTQQNSDEFMWRQFVDLVSPSATTPSKVEFETWASDSDTFTSTPQWPAPDARPKLHASLLQALKSGHSLAATLDVPCAKPGNAAVAGFPTSGTPTPCVAEETKRNKPQFDYIVNNNLNTQAGLAKAFANSAFSALVMPKESLSVKTDWVPVKTVLQWIPYTTEKFIRDNYYITTDNGTEYALVSMHVSSRQNPNWVWASFEHSLNPGRCDSIGCSDSFGSTDPVVQPNRNAANKQYGACRISTALAQLMKEKNLSSVWRSYCLKGSQVEYTASNGIPSALGNSVIEGVVGNGTISASSCIACHAYASFGKEGKPTSQTTAMLPYNPTGEPIQNVLIGSKQYDFMWGVLLAP